jgi:cell division protein FtsZ
LRIQAGENTDVIVGMGYDNSLEKKIGITMIATGFEHKNPFAKPAAPHKVETKRVKIVVTLNAHENYSNGTTPTNNSVNTADTSVSSGQDIYAPHIKEETQQEEIVSVSNHDELLEARETEILQFELSTEITDVVSPKEEVKKESDFQTAIQEYIAGMKLTEKPKECAKPLNLSILSKPVNIYAEPDASKTLNANSTNEVNETPA